MDRELLEQQMLELPIVQFEYFKTEELIFTEKVRYICRTECSQYGKSWACPPGVGTVEECREKCLSYENCLMIATIVEVRDIADINETLATRPGHEQITEQVRELMVQQGIEPYILSTEACAICEHCAWLDGQPCRHPEKMHPCVESHGINLIPTLEENGIEFQFGANVVTWVSLLFYH